jgi:hypothetical protein
VALTELKQHTKPVTCMCLDVANQQLYTGAQDGLVCAWSCASGQVGGARMRRGARVGRAPCGGGQSACRNAAGSCRSRRERGLQGWRL